ncbi:HVO_0476 family zinc finger protein [Methanobrevibacter filiformis]|uniref:Uncharacterized protein n=1 Tax=Methanobrevibacter filiformis TaxID=55758 RepID=A0A166CJX6_9EURY|nr:HVO_0476 family zinc finger protein [Methanobrevibacter filiformis]KZX14589.1 hypothetical protein MBFIL_08270 [Methanobrevibacter filiformis]
MECPICGCDSTETLKSKKVSSKSKEISELLLKCNDCGFVFKDSITETRPVEYRLIISKNNESMKTFIKLNPDDELSSGNIVLSDLGQAEINALELKSGKRVDKAFVRDVETIWSSSIEIPSRIGVSIDFGGDVTSYKIDLDRDYRIKVEDVIKLEKNIFKVHTIKTLERKMKKGAAKASVIRRVYGRPINLRNYDYDLTSNIHSKKLKKPKFS